MHIPFSEIKFKGNELKYIQEVIDSGWITSGEKCSKFEQEFALKVGAKYACAVNSATAALHLACEAVGIGPGDKVLVPTMTFTATAEVVRYLDAIPIFLDIEYGSCLITPEILQKAIAKHTGVKALIIVHFGGQAAQMDDILAICNKHNIKVLEDAAHAFPSVYNGKMIGAHSAAACFSFYANKTITTGEGGMLTTNDESIFKRVKVMRLHGINRDVWTRFKTPLSNWEYDVIAPGYKYNMTDLAAAIGLAQLEQAESLKKSRLCCAWHYFQKLADVIEVDLPLWRNPHTDHSAHLFYIVLNSKSTHSRNEMIEYLTQKGIGTSVHYKPLHRMTYYKNLYKLSPSDYPNAEKHWHGVVSLPIYSSLSISNVQYICNAIRAFFS